MLRAAAPPTHLSGPVPAAAPAPLPDGLPEHWPGREAIHEPPHPGYREVAAPAPRPVRPAPARPRRQAPPPGTDLLNGFQRWVIRSSARSMRREIEHSVRRTIGSARAEPEDTWGVATTEPPPDLSEAPECAWCPVCRAARRMRESGRPGLASVSDAVCRRGPGCIRRAGRGTLPDHGGYRTRAAGGIPVRGTPIPRVTMTMRRGHLMSLAIGVDVGGTKVAAGVVDPEGKIVEKVKRLTPAASPAATEQVIVEVVTELRDRYPVDAVGIGAAGFVDETRSTVLFAPNLAWRDEPVKKQVEDRLGCAVLVENDANAAAWAEARFGAARGQDDVLLIAVGTGIGPA